jgi:hypothetical protein
MSTPMMDDNEDEVYFDGRNRNRDKVRTKNLYTEVQGNFVCLVNYSTVIAVRAIGTNIVYFTDKRYSVTTSKIQSQLKSALTQEGAEVRTVAHDVFREMLSTGEPLQTATDVSFE